MEDVFLTHLEIEFPEFRQIAASIKGELSIHEHSFFPLFSLIFVTHHKFKHARRPHRKNEEEFKRGMRSCRLNELQKGKVFFSDPLFP